MMYGSWDNEHNGQNFLSFWTLFFPLPPLTTQKIKILNKWKKHPEILSFYTCLSKITIIWCMVPEISSTTDRLFCHFDNFLPFYPPNNSKNRNFEKLKKTPGDIIILHKCTINDNHILYGSWDMKHDGQDFVILDYFLPFYPPFPTTQKVKILKNWNILQEIS